MVSKEKEITIFGLGNPLLDITATVDDAFLEKYKLRKNSTILAANRHQAMFDELTNNYEIEYFAGGATQNTMRYCQWVIGVNRPVTTFVGAIGDDYFGKIMESNAKTDGVVVKYQVVEKKNTGTCVVMFTDGGKSRTLCAYLGASEEFDKNFLLANFSYVEKARVIYTSGHMLPVSAESVMILARHAHEWGKDFFFNLAAPYMKKRCAQEVIDLLPYVDFLFSNHNEAIAFAEIKEYKTKDLKEIARLIAHEPKLKYTSKYIPSAYKQLRIVITTQGNGNVLLARSDTDVVKEFPVKQLSDEQIKDSNCCGDAFAGGFLAMYIENKSLDECLRCAIFCATECLQQSGCTLPKNMSFK